MARRLDKTLIDYLVIAISPALIMLLVGSLVYFLIEVFYQGDYAGRLRWVFFWFVIAAVLIGRISIEEGRERAMLFAAPLAIAVLLTINRFVQFEGRLLTLLSFPVNCSLIAIVWWSANKLTWDCTLIDEAEEDSGEGLLETVGLDRPGKAALQREIAPAAPEPEGTTSREAQPQSWWERFVERRRRPHAPGVWVVYFSLAALPLFGIGQVFIPATKPDVRQYAFNLLFVYTASGLGLLLATSFLGLRRYLRQRRQEMPLKMVNLWLGIGGVLVAGVMFLAMLLPRPNAEYAVSELPFRIGSPDQTSSRYGMGRDGVKEKQPWARSEKLDDDKDKPPDSAPSDQPGKAPAQNPQTTSKDGKKPAAQQGDDAGARSKPQGKSGQKSPPPDKSGKSPPQDQKEPSSDAKAPEKQNGEKAGKESGDKSQSRRKPSDGDKSRPARDKSKNDNQPQAGEKSGKKAAEDPEAAAKKPPERTPERRPSGGRAPGKAPAPPPAAPRPPSLPDAAWFLLALKWLFYAALAVLIVYAIWTNRAAILAALGDFAQWLQDFWHHLFGGKSRRMGLVAEEAAAKPTPPPRFADFTDPFAAGLAGRYSPEELVRYTFAALEAWARDQGYPRQPEQTPHEFTRRVGSRVAALAGDAGRLAELYCQVAYAPGTLPTAGVARLSQLWLNMRVEAGVAP